MVCPAAHRKCFGSHPKISQPEKLYFDFANSNEINNKLLEHNNWLLDYLSQEGERFLSTGVTVSNIGKYHLLKRFLDALWVKHQSETSLRVTTRIINSSSNNGNKITVLTAIFQVNMG